MSELLLTLVVGFAALCGILFGYEALAGTRTRTRITE